MNTSDENWGILLSLLPAGWQQAALDSGAVKRLRGFTSPEALLRTVLLHVGLGYSLRETVVRARLSDWVEVSDVALLKRLRSSEQWLHFLCFGLLHESRAFVLEKMVGAVRVVDGTIVKEPGKHGGQWRILYSLQLPSLLCDFFEVTASGGEGNGESLNPLSVARHELILADAGYCSVAGIEYVQQRGADVLVRVNPQAYSQHGKRFTLLRNFFSIRALSITYGSTVPYRFDPRIAGSFAPKTIAEFIPSGTGRRLAGDSVWPYFLVQRPGVRCGKANTPLSRLTVAYIAGPVRNK